MNELRRILFVYGALLASFLLPNPAWADVEVLNAERPLGAFPDSTFLIADDDLIDINSPTLLVAFNEGESRFGSDPSGIGLINGSFLDDSPSFANTEGGRTYCPEHLSAVTFDLDLTVEPAGYTIGSVASISGGAQARRSQSFLLEYSVVDDDSFQTLVTEFDTEFLTDGGNGEMLVLIRDDAGAPVATGVDRIRVTYFDVLAPPAGFAESMYRELDVYVQSKTIEDLLPVVVIPEEDDTLLVSTSQIRVAAGGNGPFGGDGQVVAAVNFTNVAPSEVGVDTVLGIEFDDISIVPPGGDLAAGLFETFDLTANGVEATLETRFGFIHDRQQSASTFGTDSEVANRMLTDIHVISAPRETDDAGEQEFTIAGLQPNAAVFIQLFGGDGGWFGQTEVVVNGESHLWTSVADGNAGTASQFGFFATTSASGELDVDLNHSNPLGVGGPIFSGLAGFIVTAGEAAEPGIPGDVNLDGIVDRGDAAAVLRGLGTGADATRMMGDLDGDRAVTLLDLAIVQAHLGDFVLPSPTPVPEPAGWLLAAMCCAGLLARRRRNRMSVGRPLLAIEGPASADASITTR